MPYKYSIKGDVTSLASTFLKILSNYFLQTNKPACFVILNGLLENVVNVELLGGKVQVVWKGSENDTEYDVFLIGPAQYSFLGNFNL